MCVGSEAWVDGGRPVVRWVESGEKGECEVDDFGRAASVDGRDDGSDDGLLLAQKSRWSAVGL